MAFYIDRRGSLFFFYRDFMSDFYVLYAIQWRSCWNRSFFQLLHQRRRHPPCLCHSIDMLGSVGGPWRAALGSINFMAYFLQHRLSVCIQHGICFKCSHSCEILCIPPHVLWWARSSSRSSAHSLFLYLLPFSFALRIRVYLGNYLCWSMELWGFFSFVLEHALNFKYVKICMQKNSYGEGGAGISFFVFSLTNIGVPDSSIFKHLKKNMFSGG